MGPITGSGAALPPDVIWTRSGGGQDPSDATGGTDTAQSVALDGSGGVYVCGQAGSFAQFGNLSITNRGTPSYYLVKYDLNGNALWELRLGKIGGIII